MKFLFPVKLGLAQADGWKRPRSLFTGTGDFGWFWVSVAWSSGWRTSVSVDSSVVPSLETGVSSGESSFLDLLVRMSLPELGLSDRSLLLVSLVRPGGGDVEGLPSNEESSSGGRFRGTWDQGELLFFGLTMRTKSDAPYFILVLCLIAPFRYS